METDHQTSASYHTSSTTESSLISQPQTGQNKHKSLVVLLSVLIVGLLVVLGYLSYQNLQLRQKVEIYELENASLGTCEYNGKTYQPGEGFLDADGCNSCSCSENGQVACTTMACEPVLTTFSAVEYISEDNEFSITNTDSGFSTQFTDNSEIVVTDCEDIQGYPLVVHSKSNPNLGDGPCGVEGVSGIRIFKPTTVEVDLTCEAMGFYSSDDYKVTQVIEKPNNNTVLRCKSDFIGQNPVREYGPMIDHYEQVFISSEASSNIFEIRSTDGSLQNTLNQILSTFEFLQ